MISQIPVTGERRARIVIVGPSSRRSVSSPVAAPLSRAISATFSIVGSMNASIALRPTNEPGARPRY